jgi:hypothetical protein
LLPDALKEGKFDGGSDVTVSALSPKAGVKETENSTLGSSFTPVPAASVTVATALEVVVIEPLSTATGLGVSVRTTLAAAPNCVTVAEPVQIPAPGSLSFGMKVAVTVTVPGLSPAVKLAE